MKMSNFIRRKNNFESRRQFDLTLHFKKKFLSHWQMGILILILIFNFNFSLFWGRMKISSSVLGKLNIFFDRSVS